jgi:hypothetical protein
MLTPHEKDILGKRVDHFNTTLNGLQEKSVSNALELVFQIFPASSGSGAFIVTIETRAAAFELSGFYREPLARRSTQAGAIQKANESRDYLVAQGIEQKRIRIENPIS